MEDKKDIKEIIEAKMEEIVAKLNVIQRAYTLLSVFISFAFIITILIIFFLDNV